MKTDLSIETICAVFCKFNRTNPLDLYNRSRERRVNETRRMVWGYLRENTPMTFTALGKLFGRDHATAMYAVSKHKISVSVSPRGSCYDIEYSDTYRASILEINSLTEDAKNKLKYSKSYMLTYYCPTTDRYTAPVIKSTSLREAIDDYELYNPIINEELVLAKAL
jgi:hypothetical protein